MLSLATLRTEVLLRLGDQRQQIWTAAEVDDYLRTAYRQLAEQTRVFADWLYLENLPRGFSYTAAWEKMYGHVTFDYGMANYTYADERRELDERNRMGPANHTSPFEATAAHLTNAGASTAISATADVPTSLTELDRVCWDGRPIQPLTPRRLSDLDSRYQTTTGEVYGYTWRQDGLRTVRKVRVPAAAASTYSITGSWGAMRTITDFLQGASSGSWGLPRRIPGEHPLGPERFGAPRRPYRDGTNVRVEHWRHGRRLSDGLAVCELPTRYARYLRDFAQGRCLARAGPGHDATLAGHYDRRWGRHLTRILRRLERLAAGRVGQLGGTVRIRTRPPRPRLPWAFGSVVR